MELTDFVTLTLGVVLVLGVSLALYWRHVLQPLQGTIETIIPLLVDLSKMLPGTFATQRDMIAQSQEQAISLKEAIGLLDDAAERARWRDERNQEAGEALKMALHGDRVLAQQDRDQLAKLIVLLDRLAIERCPGGHRPDRPGVEGRYRLCRGGR